MPIPDNYIIEVIPINKDDLDKILANFLLSFARSLEIGLDTLTKKIYFDYNLFFMI